MVQHFLALDWHVFFKLPCLRFARQRTATMLHMFHCNQQPNYTKLTSFPGCAVWASWLQSLPWQKLSVVFVVHSLKLVPELVGLHLSFYQRSACRSQCFTSVTCRNYFWKTRSFDSASHILCCFTRCSMQSCPRGFRHSQQIQCTYYSPQTWSMPRSI